MSLRWMMPIIRIKEIRIQIAAYVLERMRDCLLADELNPATKYCLYALFLTGALMISAFEEE